jgi:WD40 repeat protein
MVIGSHNVVVHYHADERTWATRPERVPLEGSPYRGLSAFDVGDGDWFFGRDKATGKVLERLSQRLGDPGMLVVSGASGAGKSSLLRAGALPQLRRQGLASAPGARSWPCLLFTPGRSPLDELAVQVASVAGTDVSTVRQALASRPSDFALYARQAVLTQGGDPASPGTGRLLLIIDQFEQLFSVCPDEAQRQAFIAALHVAATIPLGDDQVPPALVVLGVRSDFETRCAAYPELATAIQDRYLLTAMAPLELLEAITSPAAKADSSIEPHLTEALLREIGVRQPDAAPGAVTGPGVLALLSHALDQTWRSRTGKTLTLADYVRTGGIEAAVARSAEGAYNDLSPAQQIIAQRVFTMLAAAAGPEGMDTAIPVATNEVTALADGVKGARDGDVATVLDAFVARRLLTLSADTVEIVHEVLLTAWPLLRDTWLAETRTDRIVRTGLRGASAEWQRRNRDSAYLYTGSLLQTAIATEKRSRADSTQYPPLAAGEQSFLAASRHAQQRRRAVLPVICALILAAGTVGVVAVLDGQDAARSAAITQANSLAADAASLVPTDPGLAAQIAVAAYRVSPTPSASSQLYASLQTPLDRVLSATGSGVLRVAAQSHGPLAAAVDSNGSLRVWDSTGIGKLESTLRSAPAAIALAPRRALLAGACPGREALCLWSLSDPRRPVLQSSLPLPANTHGITSMAISGDGTLLAAAVEQGLTLVWSISNPQRPQEVAQLPDPSTDPSAGLPAVAFSPHTNLLAQTIQHGRTQLWSLNNPHAPVKQATIPGGYRAIAFSPDGTLLSAVGVAGTGLWKVTNPARPASIRVAPDGSVDLETSVAFSPDGKWLAYGGTGLGSPQSALCLVDLSPASLGASGGPTPDCTPTGFGTYTTVYTPNGALLTGGADGNVRLWRQPLPQGSGMSIGSSFSWGISPDGRLIAAPLGSADTDFPSSSIGIWENSGTSGLVREATITLTAGTQVIQFIRSTGLLTVAADGTVELWNLSDVRHPDKAASLGKVAFAGSSTVIASAGVSADAAGDLIGVQGDDRLNLWRVSGSVTARSAGSLPIRSPGFADVLDDHTALVITRTGVTWWNISNPSRPRQGTVSNLPGADMGTLIGSAGIAAATTSITETGSNLTVFTVDDGLVHNSVSLPGAAGSNLGLSDDPRLLAVGGPGANTVRLWDISNPAQPVDKAAIGTLQNINGITFGPADRLMADWNDDQIQLWDLRDPSNPVQVGSITPPSQDGFVESAAFTPTGGTLAIADEDSLILYDTDPADLASELCTYTGGITTAQWTQYAPGIPYQNPCRGNRS